MDPQQTTEDVDLTGGVEAPEGPNAPHPNAPEADLTAPLPEEQVEPSEDEIAAMAAEERAIIEAQASEALEQEEGAWDGDAGNEASDPTVPTATPPESEPTPEPQPTTTEPVSTPPVAAAPTEADDGPSDGDEAEEGEQTTRQSPSGEPTRPYTFLEEQQVVPVHVLAEILTEPQMKKVIEAKAATNGFIALKKKVTTRNADLALDQVYGGENGGADEHVTAVLVLSERNYRPVELEAEVETKTKLSFKRR